MKEHSIGCQCFEKKTNEEKNTTKEWVVGKKGQVLEKYQWMAYRHYRWYPYSIYLSSLWTQLFFVVVVVAIDSLEEKKIIACLLDRHSWLGIEFEFLWFVSSQRKKRWFGGFSMGLLNRFWSSNKVHIFLGRMENIKSISTLFFTNSVTSPENIIKNCPYKCKILGHIRAKKKKFSQHLRMIHINRLCEWTFRTNKKK